MKSQLAISVGQFSERGKKPSNQDFFGVRFPGNRLIETKGIAAAIADGVSTSERARDAAEASVTGFLEDYLSTPESWSVQHSAQQVLTALNAWLYAQGRGYRDAHRGCVSTFSALVLKSTTAHCFHVGDSRIYRLRHNALEQCTTDHKTWVANDRSYLSRALGADPRVDIDYRKLPLELGDLFLFTTDGVHDYIPEKDLLNLLRDNAKQLDKCAEILVRTALSNGSPDNSTCQIIRVEQLPGQDPEEVYQHLTELPFPPDLLPGVVLDGYRIVRELHSSEHTQVYLAEDLRTGEQVTLKTPSVNYEDDPAYIEQFMLEEWVGKRLDNPHLLKIHTPKQPRRFLYGITEYVDGQTLRQWSHDHPRADIETVRKLIEQIARGVQAMHRMEMVHRDLKPENILIDANGTAKIIDFGSTRVAGIAEIAAPFSRRDRLGTRHYTAPERGLEQVGDQRCDIFSLGVITYELLTGHLPYAERLADRPTRYTAKYISAQTHRASLPEWLDGALARAVHPDPAKRYNELSEFLFDLRHANAAFLPTRKRPLIERHPAGFWRGVALLLLVGNLILSYLLLR